MFGREKVECPGCKKVFRKKYMKTQCKDAKGRNSKYYNQYSCADCCFKKTQYWEKEDAKEEGMRDAVWDGLTKTDSSEKLSRLYQERKNLEKEAERLQDRLWEAEDNVNEAVTMYDNSVGGRPTSLFGVATDFLTESYKTKPGYQTAVGEKGRIEASLNDLDRAITKNRNETLKEIGRIEENGNKEPDGKAESTVKRLQNLMDNTISEVINRAEQHSSNWQTKRDEIKEPVEQNNDNSFCDNCGKSLKPTAKFCGGCGTPRS